MMDVQPTNLQQLRDAIMSILTKILEECFQQPGSSEDKRGSNPDKPMYLIKWPMSVCVCVCVCVYYINVCAI